jgi:Coenzyme PQQ synthesis protein D (PqqD)
MAAGIADVEVPAATISPERYLRDQRAVTRDVAGETVIVPVTNHVADLEAIYTLNATGTFLWNRLDSPRSVPELASALAAAFEVNHDRAAADVEQILQDLRQEGLVQVAIAPAAAGR